jgi:N-acetylneuraminate lyase
MGLLSLVVAGAAASGVAAARRSVPYTPLSPHLTLHAPFTPFAVDGSGGVNLSVIPALAADAAASGVNLVWVVGGMGQFDTLTLDERRAVLEAWVPAAHAHGMAVVAHVGTTVQADAIAMAAHAVAVGADAIASVPPYYTKAASVAALVSWLAPVAAAAPSLPFLFYHIPASTGVDFPMAQLFPAALAAIPTWAGVKFVSTDMGDWAALAGAYGDDPSLALMFAPEPKMAGVGLGATSAVLAESFFAPTWLRMCRAAAAGDWAGARREQAWKAAAAAVFASVPGDAERAIYRAKIGVDLGPPRAPDVAVSEADLATVVAGLSALGFFNASQTANPGPCTL